MFVTAISLAEFDDTLVNSLLVSVISADEEALNASITYSTYNATLVIAKVKKVGRKHSC